MRHPAPALPCRSSSGSGLLKRRPGRFDWPAGTGAAVVIVLPSTCDKMLEVKKLSSTICSVREPEAVGLALTLWACAFSLGVGVPHSRWKCSPFSRFLSPLSRAAVDQLVALARLASAFPRRALRAWTYRGESPMSTSAPRMPRRQVGETPSREMGFPYRVRSAAQSVFEPHA